MILTKKNILAAIFVLIFSISLSACFAPKTSSSASSAPTAIVPSSSSQPAISSSLPPYQSPIDFAALQEQNPDIYAWIRIPSTNVDYPIVQSPHHDEYYLRRDLDGKGVLAGSIFTQKTYNSKDFNDPHTVIYGHNMEALDGTMFSQVHDYRKKSFFDEHREVIVYLPEKELHYKVFAAYKWNDEHLLYAYDTKTVEIFQSYINSVFGNRDLTAIIDNDVPVSSDDKIITLSTCDSSYPGADRFLVQAVLETEIE